MRSYLIAGNWKMNCGPAEAAELAGGIAAGLKPDRERVDVLICPPSVSIPAAAEAAAGSEIKVGAQNVHFEDNGAYTGEISTGMLRELNCSHVIIGHSERREYFGESDRDVNRKVQKAIAAGIIPVICVGESLDQRKEGSHTGVVSEQVERALESVGPEDAATAVIAYEPLWAIGTGETASPQQAQEMHAIIREVLERIYRRETSETVPILYGGSMKPHNAEELLSQPDVDGGLIGGASLKADSFVSIIEIAQQISRS